MLKRCQILLTDWQQEYIRDTAQRYDLSFSEVTRIFLSEGFLYIIPLCGGSNENIVARNKSIL
jgi:hypothetical protein